MIKLSKKLILGSSSPRRHDILTMLGIPFTLLNPQADETFNAELSLLELRKVPQNLASEKALSLTSLEKDKLILSFDTMVFFNGKAMGKPTDTENAFEMLKTLNGNSHEVITGAAVAYKGKLIDSISETTRVFFEKHPHSLLKTYVNTGEPLDKAGSYGIQGKGALLVKKIEGCFFNVMGLPLQSTMKMLHPWTKNNE